MGTGTQTLAERILRALGRKPALRDLRQEFPEWDITGTRREGFTATWTPPACPSCGSENPEFFWIPASGSRDCKDRWHDRAGCPDHPEEGKR